MALEGGRHPGHVIDHRAHRIAGIGCRKWPVHHIDPVDLLGCDQAPTRHITQATHAVAQIVRQQDAVAIDHRPGAVAGARGPARQDRVVVVADIAFAHQQAREVFQCVFAVGRIDGLLDLQAINAFHRGRYLCRQGGGLGSRDDHNRWQKPGACVGSLTHDRRGEAEGRRGRQGHEAQRTGLCAQSKMCSQTGRSFDDFQFDSGIGDEQNRPASSGAANSHRSDAKRLRRQAIAGGARAGGRLAEGAAPAGELGESDDATPCTGWRAGGWAAGGGAANDAHRGQSSEAAKTTS